MESISNTWMKIFLSESIDSKGLKCIEYNTIIIIK